MRTSEPAAPALRSRALAQLQRLGRSLMLPIAVLPAAALLLRFGQPDMLGEEGLGWDPIARVFAAAGGALYTNMPLLFAVGVSIGFARRSDGSTALAAVVAYLVFHWVSMTMFEGSGMTVRDLTYEVVDQGETREVLNIGLQNPTGVLGGIIVGLTTAWLWQRYHRIKLPIWLAFFGGRRFVPIAAAFAALVIGVLCGWTWPTIGGWLNSAGEGLTGAGAAGTGIYGVINRLLIPLGLHHFVNSIVWYVIPKCEAGVNGATVDASGDWGCYFAGDMTAGSYMAGFFPITMFGLPAAALAITLAAPREQRRTVGGLMFSAALASVVTGITEPVEFAFIFAAPVLFVAHALLTGTSMLLTELIGGSLGFGFSAGLIDMVLNAGKSNTQNLPGILLLGVMYFVVYYVVFHFLIRWLNILTPGREPAGEGDVSAEEGRASK